MLFYPEKGKHGKTWRPCNFKVKRSLSENVMDYTILMMHHSRRVKREIRRLGVERERYAPKE